MGSVFSEHARRRQAQTLLNWWMSVTYADEDWRQSVERDSFLIALATLMRAQHAFDDRWPLVWPKIILLRRDFWNLGPRGWMELPELSMTVQKRDVVAMGHLGAHAVALYFTREGVYIVDPNYGLVNPSAYPGSYAETRVDDVLGRVYGGPEEVRLRRGVDRQDTFETDGRRYVLWDPTLSSSWWADCNQIAIQEILTSMSGSMNLRGLCLVLSLTLCAVLVSMVRTGHFVKDYRALRDLCDGEPVALASAVASVLSELCALVQGRHSDMALLHKTSPDAPPAWSRALRHPPRGGTTAWQWAALFVVERVLRHRRTTTDDPSLYVLAVCPEGGGVVALRVVTNLPWTDEGAIRALQTHVEEMGMEFPQQAEPACVFVLPVRTDCPIADPGGAFTGGCVYPLEGWRRRPRRRTSVGAHVPCQGL